MSRAVAASRRRVASALATSPSLPEAAVLMLFGYA